jgi:hypothetical protein
MTRAARVLLVAAVTLSVVGHARSSAALPILSGSLTVDRFIGTVSLVGGEDRGFTFDARVGITMGVFEPWLECSSLPPCGEGTFVGLDTHWSGTDLFGMPNTTTGAVATIDGNRYERVGGSAPSSSAAVIRFLGTAGPLPSLTSGETATLVAPFLFDGSFRYDPNPQAPVGSVLEALTGQGTATITFTRSLEFQRWNFLSAQYVFQAPPPPPPPSVPEPGTLGLILAGAAAYAVLRRLRHRTTH